MRNRKIEKSVLVDGESGKILISRFPGSDKISVTETEHFCGEYVLILSRERLGGLIDVLAEERFY